MRVVKAICHIVGTGALLALCAVAVSVVASMWVLPRVTPIETRTVLTNSMAPAMPEGSLAFVRPVATNRIAVGDIISFHPNDGPVIVSHRVEAIVRGSDASLAFRTKGDNNAADDPRPVPASAVVGKVILRARWVGLASEWAQTANGRLLAFFLPLGIFVAANLYTLVSEMLGLARDRRTRAALVYDDE